MVVVALICIPHTVQVRVVEADSESMEEKYVAELLTSGVRILHLIRVYL